MKLLLLLLLPVVVVVVVAAVAVVVVVVVYPFGTYGFLKHLHRTLARLCFTFFL
jgi:hypothetical protein